MTFFKQRWILIIFISVFVILVFSIIFSQRQNSQQTINPTVNTNKELKQGNTNQTTSPVTKEFKAQAEAALAKGTILEDGKDDWVTTGYEGDNPSFYKVSWIDIKSVVFGTDEEYFYLKWIFNGKLPSSLPDWSSFNGDQLKSVGFNIYIDTDNEQGVGGDTRLFGEIAIYGFINSPGPEYPFGISFLTNPVSKPYIPEDEAYENSYDAIYKWGGPGFDYVAVAAPLNILNIKKDQTVTVNIWAEAESEQYHHATFDTINLTDPNEDDATKIQIKLGTSEVIKPTY